MRALQYGGVQPFPLNDTNVRQYYGIYHTKAMRHQHGGVQPFPLNDTTVRQYYGICHTKAAHH